MTETSFLIVLFQHSFEENLISTLFFCYAQMPGGTVSDPKLKDTGNGSKLLFRMQVIGKRKKMLLKLTISKLVKDQKHKVS